MAAVVDAELAVAAADAEEEAAEQNWIAAGRTLSILCVSVCLNQMLFTSICLGKLNLTDGNILATVFEHTRQPLVVDGLVVALNTEADCVSYGAVGCLLSRIFKAVYGTLRKVV